MSIRGWVALLFFASTVPGLDAAPPKAPENEFLIAIDEQASTLTVRQGKAAPQVYRFRPSLEVFINNARGHLSELAEGMSVRVTTGEPGLAARIEASGTPRVPKSPSLPNAGAGADPGGMSTLEQRLLGTKWRWYKGRKYDEILTFAAGGTATMENHDGPPILFNVKPSGTPNRLQGVRGDNQHTFTIDFDATLETGTIEEEGRKRDTHIMR